MNPLNPDIKTGSREGTKEEVETGGSDSSVESKIVPEAFVDREGNERSAGLEGDAKEEAKENSKETEGKDKSSNLFKWFMSSKWRLSLSLLSLGAGTVFAMVAYIYPQRMVRALTYVRPTQVLEVETYTPWGAAKKLGVPLNDVFCNTSPEQVANGQNIALKLKNYSLYFMLNTKNTTSHPMLKTLVLNRRYVL